jgi:hypothetical protein
MKVRTKLKLVFLLIVICVGSGFYIAYRIFDNSHKATQTWTVPNPSTPSKKFITQETLINQLQQKQELIPLEVDLTERVTLDNSWGTLDLFKKIQSIYFEGKGIYSLDLSRLYSESASIDNVKKRIAIRIPKPTVKTISIEEQKTKYETPQNGLLRFGEIKMSAEEFQTMVSEAKTRMTEKLNGDDLYNKAMQSSEEAVSSLVKAILSDQADDNYHIVIDFEH